MKMEHDGTKPQGSWGRGSAEGAEIEQNDLAMENTALVLRTQHEKLATTRPKINPRFTFTGWVYLQFCLLRKRSFHALRSLSVSLPVPRLSLATVSSFSAGDSFDLHPFPFWSDSGQNVVTRRSKACSCDQLISVAYLDMSWHIHLSMTC